MAFWENVQFLLNERGISSRTLAREINLSPASLSKYARGSVPGLDVATRIAEFLGVSMDSLIWGQGAGAAKRLCPAPGDHQLLHELVEGLGLEDLRRMSLLSSQAVAWQIAELLAARFPQPVSLDELLSALSQESQETVRASLLGLRRQGIIGEMTGTASPSYVLLEHVPRFSAGEAGDLSQHIMRAARILFTEVLPALERRNGSAHLRTVVAHISSDAADQMVREIYEMVKVRSAEFTGLEAGAAEVHMVFGIGKSKHL